MFVAKDTLALASQKAAFAQPEFANVIVVVVAAESPVIAPPALVEYVAGVPAEAVGIVDVVWIVPEK